MGIKDILTKEEYGTYLSVVRSKKHLRNHPSYLGNGCSRIVFALSDRYVLKVDFDGLDLNEYGLCESEHEVYKRSKDKSFLAEIIFFKQNRLIMERAERTLYHLECKNMAKLLEKKRKELKIVDLHEGNIGIFKDGSKKAIDYAYLKEFRYSCSDSSSYVSYT